MTKRKTEQRVKQYFESVPEPDRRTYEETVTLAIEAATCRSDMRKDRVSKPDSHTALLAPSFVGLVIAQARITKGLVWILQAIVVMAALVFIAGADGMATTLAAFGAASAILAGVSLAGIGFHKGQEALTEITYSCHFDYRQVVVARMIAYGIGDGAALCVLLGFGGLMLPDGLAAAALCSAASFFTSGFVCMFALARYRGESAPVLCGILSGAIAAFTSYAWSFHFEFFQRTNTVFWLVLAVGAACGILYCAHVLVARIDAGFDHVSPDTN